MKFNASSAANGVGESVGEFSPSGSSGSTGGQGFRNGSLNVSGATSQSSLSSVGTLVGSTLSVMAMIVGGGAAFGFNSFGEAGGLGSASTTGSATGSLGTDLEMVRLSAISTRPDPVVFGTHFSSLCSPADTVYI